MTSGDLNIEDTIREAMALHQAGRIGEAAPLYNRVLAIAPDNFNALLLAGTLAEQVGQSETAVGLLTRASQVDPNNVLPLPKSCQCAHPTWAV